MSSANLTIAGTITQAPIAVTDQTFPAGTTQIPLVSNPSPKVSAQRSSGSRNISSTASFTPVSGVGPTDDVTRGDFIYFKCDAPCQLQLTQADPAGGADIASIINIQGLCMIEFSPSGYLKTLAVKGTANIEYLISGPQ